MSELPVEVVFELVFELAVELVSLVAGDMVLVLPLRLISPWLAGNCVVSLLCGCRVCCCSDGSTAGCADICCCASASRLTWSTVVRVSLLRCCNSSDWA